MAVADIIKQNSHVLFFFNRSKKWLVPGIRRGEELHTHIGVLPHTDAIGKKYGSRLVTNKSKYVYLLKPTIYDYTMKLQHGTQIVYPKELGYIAARTGIGSGQKVVEIGTGSGSLTSFVANVVRPRGHVYSFDVDEKFIKIAQKNIDRAGVSKYVTLENMDIKQIDPEASEMPVSDADIALVDLGDPWEVLPQVRAMLRGSGSVFAVCPTINQLEKLSVSLVKNEFTDIESTELILRNIEAREGKSRHSFQGIGHTTYLCYARKAYFGYDGDDDDNNNDNTDRYVGGGDDDDDDNNDADASGARPKQNTVPASSRRSRSGGGRVDKTAAEPERKPRPKKARAKTVRGATKAKNIDASSKRGAKTAAAKTALKRAK